MLLTRRALPLLREALLMAALLTLYSAARLLGSNGVTEAFRNARALMDLQRWLHLPAEQSLQSILLSRETLTQAANAYYASAHLSVTAIALVWLFLRRPAYYLWARRALGLSTAAALCVYLLLPVAPPRMFESLGFVDTAMLYGQSVYGSSTANSLTNQFAAMPSLHVGWSVLVACICIAASRTRWRWLWVAHPLLTATLVVATGNHYWLDGVAGAGLVAAALAIGRIRSETDVVEPLQPPDEVVVGRIAA